MHSDSLTVSRMTLMASPPGTLALDHSQLERLRDVNEDIRTSMEPLAQVPPQKVFKPKYPIPALSNYNKDIYPHSLPTSERQCRLILK